jgi:hypothetical protein
MRIINNGRPVIYKSYVNYRFRSRNEALETNLQLLAKYKTTANKAIQGRVAVSAVSAANALQISTRKFPAGIWRPAIQVWLPIVS